MRRSVWHAEPYLWPPLYLFFIFLYHIPSAALANSRFAPNAFEVLCKEGETCNVPEQATTIYYGNNCHYLQKSLTGRFICSEETFGSLNFPLARGDRACMKQSTGNNPNAASPFGPPNKPGGMPDLSTLPGSGGKSNPEISTECEAGSVIENKIVDCKGKRVGLTCPDKEDESLRSVFALKNATVMNAIIDKKGGAAGIHCLKGDCAAVNIVWEDVCEDAATNKSAGGTFYIIGGEIHDSNSGLGGPPDKVFQHNSKESRFVLTGGLKIVGDIGKLWRSNGSGRDNGGPRYVTIDDIVIDANIRAGVAVPNVNFGDVVEIKKIRIKNYKPGKPRICLATISEIGSRPRSRGEEWNTKNCKVSKDIIENF